MRLLLLADLRRSTAVTKILSSCFPGASHMQGQGRCGSDEIEASKTRDLEGEGIDISIANK